MGFLSNLFGGGKDKAKSAEAKPVAAQTAAAPVEKAAAKLAKGKPVAAAAPVAATGVTQVKLRLRLAAAERAGDIATAYQAAKGLADIQARAGRRVAERVWREEAERIIEQA